MELIQSIRQSLRGILVGQNRPIPRSRYQSQGDIAPDNVSWYVRETVVQAGEGPATQNSRTENFLARFDVFVPRRDNAAAFGSAERIAGSIRAALDPFSPCPGAGMLPLPDWSGVQAYVARVTMEVPSLDAGDGGFYRVPVQAEISAVVDLGSGFRAG